MSHSDFSSTDFKTTRQLVKDLKSLDVNGTLSVVLIDVSHAAHEYMHDDRYASARRLMSLNDMCQNILDHDQLFEAVSAHVGESHGKEVIEDAFVEALEFSDEIHGLTHGKLEGALSKSNGYGVAGISQRGQLVVGFFS